MLDFYLIQSDQPKPGYPEQVDLEFAGGLDDGTFDNLKKKGIIEDRFDYYTDFRWSASVVDQKYTEIFENKLDQDSDVKKLFEVLEKARKKECGLIAYCD